MSYDEVKQHVLDYHQRNSHFSFHKHDDPAYKAVLEMDDAAPHLFRLMQELPFESVHFGFNAIPELIETPTHIHDQLMEVRGYVAKMEEIYRQWGIEIGALV